MKKDLEAIEIENLHFIIKKMYGVSRNQFTFGVNAKERNKTGVYRKKSRNGKEDSNWY